ncbi:hypothetical protein AB0L70_39750 [Kribbella sp. NPDC051952]|uniref:hypothetical protein n=1 Tax=Kribbella sp. NPDC051952 TaxID=3154851 RepID=UPI003435B97A
MTAAEKISQWLVEARSSGRAALLARFVIAFAGTVALVVPPLQSWDQMDLIPIIGVPMLAATVVLPDSLAGLVFMLIVTFGWFLRAPAEITWSLALTAIALLVLHLATSFAAQVPSYAQIHREALRRWLLPTAIAVLIVPVVAVAAALVQGAAIKGSLLVTVGALVLTTLTIWFAAGQKLTRN